MFFSSSNYSPAAESEAALGGVALFVFNSHSGRLKPHNSQAEEIVTNAPNEMSPLAIANAKGLLESTLNCLDGGANSLHALADGVYAAGMRLDDPEWVLLNAIAARVSQMTGDWASRKSRSNENAESSVRRHLSANQLVLIGTNIDDVLTEIRTAVGRIQKRPTQDTMIIAELNPQQY